MSTRVVTGKVRFSYFSALSARKNEMNGKEEFSTQVLVPKSDTETINALKAAAKAALTAKFGDKIPKTVRNPLRDGNPGNFHYHVPCSASINALLMRHGIGSLTTISGTQTSVLLPFLSQYVRLLYCPIAPTAHVR